MIAANELCEKFHEPLEEHGGYIFGKSGQKWTQAKQDAATRPQTVSYGQQWVGHRVWDCSGMFVWAYKAFGESIYHGSNTIWRSYCSKQGKLKNGQRCDGIAMKPGTAVFLLNDTGRHHIGLYVGNDTVIEAKGTRYGVVTSKPSHWDEWGELKDVDYSMYPDEEIPVSKPTLRKGDRGDEVKELQQMLTDAGYGNIVGKIDGVFGSKTEAESLMQAIQDKAYSLAFNMVSCSPNSNTALATIYRLSATFTATVDWNGNIYARR